MKLTDKEKRLTIEDYELEQQTIREHFKEIEEYEHRFCGCTKCEN